MVDYIVEDIPEADKRFHQSGAMGASSTMGFLAQDMDRLLDAGMPQVSDEAGYHALVTTLGQFYEKAANQLLSGNVTGAAATYSVARERTSELLRILNPVLGTKYSLPKWSFM